MNAIGIALVWCVAQVTLFSLLATSLYLAVRRLRPAAAATVVLTGMMIVILLSLSAEILEVHVWDGIHAVVIAREELPGDQGSFLDMRWLTRVQGRWLNEGNDSRRTIEAARRKIEESRSH